MRRKPGARAVSAVPTSRRNSIAGNGKICEKSSNRNLAILWGAPWGSQKKVPLLASLNIQLLDLIGSWMIKRRRAGRWGEQRAKPLENLRGKQRKGDVSEVHTAYRNRIMVQADTGDAC